jgi:asparagine synthase (glutamine-hydrolysing)
MCGIAGIVRYDVPAATQRTRLERMRARLRHRGPDGAGTHIADHAALAHTRLALVDAAGGAQPMLSPDGRYAIVYNGEVYNLAELRAALAPDWRFRTRSDAEVVLAAYAAWGEDCPRRLDGMFAFFVWDVRHARGFGARDRLGVKPFVYASDGRELLFASEAKALLPVLPAPPRARLEPLLEVLAAPAFSGVERPLFEGLEYLAPGHCLRVDRDCVSTWAWGDYDLGGPFLDDAGEAAARVREALARSVAGALEADAPVGLFLSGGLDSTLLAALARRAGAAPTAFTIAFADQARYDYERSRIVTSDDGPFARLAAERLGLAQEIVPVERDGLAADLRALARANDALPAWEQEIAQHHLARAAARRGWKAVLVGDAADETHYGYHFLLDAAATERPARILERFAAPAIRADVMPDPIAHFDDKYRALAVAAGHRWDTPRARMLATTWLIVKRWLPRLLHNGDLHGMAHGLEARVPFAGAEVLAAARVVPPELALEGGVEKSVLRAAARGLVPDEIARRRKSALPKDQHVETIYRREAARLLDETGDLVGGVVDVPRLRALCDAAHPLVENERALLFRVIGLVHWARAYEVRIR